MGALLTTPLHFLGLPAVLGTEPRALCLLGKCFPHELPLAKGCGFFLFSVFFAPPSAMPFQDPHLPGFLITHNIVLVCLWSYISFRFLATNLDSPVPVTSQHRHF